MLHGACVLSMLLNAAVDGPPERVNLKPADPVKLIFDTDIGNDVDDALALGVIGFVVGKITATFSAPIFPKYVLLTPMDSIVGFFAVLVICVLASLVAIRMALQVDPAEAIG